MGCARTAENLSHLSGILSAMSSGIFSGILFGKHVAILFENAMRLLSDILLAFFLTVVLLGARVMLVFGESWRARSPSCSGPASHRGTLGARDTVQVQGKSASLTRLARKLAAKRGRQKKYGGKERRKAPCLESGDPIGQVGNSRS